MNAENRLVFELQGKGYDEQATITFSDTKSILLFGELSYLLVSSYDDELQMNLNFGGKLFLPHVIRSWGNLLILVPKFYSVDSGRYPSKNMYLDICKYLTLSLHRVLAFPRTDLFHLWSQLNYDLSELEQIHEVSQGELIQMWMIGSGYQIYESSTPFEIDTYAREVLTHIIAEESPLEISIKHIISRLIDKKVSLRSLPLAAKVDRYHLVYLINRNNFVTEWRALAVDGSNVYIVIGHYLLSIDVL